ncbi:DUF4384 domain-containing protein [Treponema sp. R80B11-R83G3]
MKTISKTTIFCVLLLVCASLGNAQTKGKQQTAAQKQNDTEMVNLNTAVGDFSTYIAGRLPKNTLTAVAITDSPVQRLGNYVADKLTDSLLNGSGIRLVSRQDIDRVFSEQNIQTGSFNDDTTAKIGHNLGWRSIIYGRIEPLQEAYSLSLRAVDVETGELRGSKSYILDGGDPILINLVNPNITIKKLTDREALLQPFDGKRNNFTLNVTANKSVYYDSEELYITLRSSEDCYFVIYHLDIDNNMQIIYPNFWEKDKNFLKANTTRVIPENTSFALHAPYGEERLLVYASVRPFNIPEDQYSSKPVTKDYLASPQALWRIESGGGGSKALSVVPKGATAQISYTILPGK